MQLTFCAKRVNLKFIFLKFLFLKLKKNIVNFSFIKAVSLRDLKYIHTYIHKVSDIIVFIRVLLSTSYNLESKTQGYKKCFQ